VEDHSVASVAAEAAATAPSEAAAATVEASPAVERSAPAEHEAATEPDLLSEPGLLSEKWYARFQDGQKSGWLHVRWTRSEFDGRETVHDRTESYDLSTRRMGSVEDRFEAGSVADLERTPEGRLLHQRSEVRQGGRVTVSEIEWTGSGYRLRSSGGGARDQREVACDEPTFVDTESFLHERVRSGTLEVGQTFEYSQPNFLAGRLDTTVVEVEGSELLSLATGPAECWRVRESVKGAPAQVRLWIDRHGIVRQLTAVSIRLVHTTAVRAKEIRGGGASYSITVDAEPHLPRSTSFDRCEVDVILRERENTPLPDFPVTPFSRELSRDGNRIRMELTRHDDPTATVGLPVEDPALAEHLESSMLFPLEHERVQRALRTALRGQPAGAKGSVRDGRDTALRLLEFVFMTLDKRSGPIPSPNAAEILRDGCGDCSEHNVLFVALCRAAGLPARRLSGYAQVGDKWGGHAFCEVWLGKWVGADPTTNELGTAARYIAFGWGDDPDSYPGVVGTRVRGRMRIVTRQFTDGGETVDLTKRASHGALREPRSGLVCAPLPEDWTARLGPQTGYGRITGPGVSCSVHVQSGMGRLPVHLLGMYMLRGAGEAGEFGGLPALVQRTSRRGRESLRVAIPYRRRTMMLNVRLEPGTDEAAALKQLGELLRPSLAPGAGGKKAPEAE
jgi:transglutaminase-like putative cysteine protease